jgi:hypothetical protein
MVGVMRRNALAFLIITLLTLPSLSGLAEGQSSSVPFSTGFVAAGGGDFVAMRRGGASSVKLVADWSEIEPDRGAFDWKELDAAVAAATGAGLSVTLVLAYTPKWASLATGSELQDPAIWSRQPPKQIADWATFVAKAASRYKGRVKDWQVWTVLSLPIWRGTAREYQALVRAAKTATKGADAASRVVLATPFGLDLISIRRAVLEIPESFDAISLSPRGLAPEALLRPLRVLRERLLARTQKAVRIEWDPRAGGERSGWSAQMLKVVAIAKAFNVERVDWAIDPSIGMGAQEIMSARLGSKAFAGYIIQPKTIALVFGETDAVAVAWSTGGEVTLALEGEGITAVNPAGDPRTVSAGSGKSTLTLAAEPLLISGLGSAAVTSARETLAARGAPDLPRIQDFSGAAEVSAKLGKANVENGLYNMLFRTRRNGALEVVDVDGSEAVRTVVARDIVFVYFDVDDTFLFYVDGRYDVEVSVEVRGAGAPQQLGFNLYYDSMRDYRFTTRQLVEAKDGWVTYTFRLSDAAFANTWGWDFAVNGVGNRKEDLTVRSVTVRKITR